MDRRLDQDAIRRSRAAEKGHVREMPDVEVLLHKPFPGGTGLDVERARREIALFAAMLQSLPVGPGATVLDLGAGSGWLSEWLQRMRYRTVSVDISLDMLRIARRRLAPGSRLCVADMARLPLADVSMDAAVCYGALHHVPNWTAALAEIFRVLKPGGVLVLQEPGRGHSRQGESVAQTQQFGVLEQDLPPGRLARACRRAGFTRTVIRPPAELSSGLVRILPPYPFLRQAPRLFLRRRLARARARLTDALLNLVSPLHVVVAIKGTAAADSSRPDVMVARFLDVECPTDGPAGGTVAFAARIENTGNTRWLARGRDGTLGQVRLGVSRCDAEGALKQLDHYRLDLPRDIAPGETVFLQGEAPLPTEPGPAQFRFDLVAEGIAWFSDRGSRPVFRPGKVTPPDE